MPSSINPDFVLEKATIGDAGSIAQIFFSAFHSEPFFVEMCPKTPDSMASWERSLIFAINDCKTHVLKVTDKRTGKIICSGQWIDPKKDDEITQPGNEEGRWADLPAHCDEELANSLFGSFHENRSIMMGNRPHFYMELLHTMEDYKGQGAGSMVLQYGCDLADRDSVEAYIDASPRGKRLYERFGFVFTKQQKMPRFDYYYNYGIRQPKKQ